jgi:hypothetical protein
VTHFEWAINGQLTPARAYGAIGLREKLIFLDLLTLRGEVADVAAVSWHPQEFLDLWLKSGPA